MKGRAIRCAAAAAVAIAAIAGVACDEDPEYVPPADFDAFALEIADALVRGDLEHLMVNTNKVRFTCEGEIAQQVQLCEGVAAGAVAEGFDVKFQGAGATPTLLDSTAMRLMVDGMFNDEAGAPADEVGSPYLQLFSTLHPDPTIWFPGDEQELPERGQLAITYIGASPAEDDFTVKRRLFAAVAERDGGGRWAIRLWLVGFYRPDHPALHPGDGNDYVRWHPPG